MESYIKHYSELLPYQQAHSVVYSLLCESNGARLQVARKEWQPTVWQAAQAVPASTACLLLRYLYENSVSPEACQDVLEELL